MRGALATMGVDRATVAGHSYGGSVALAWALDAPDSVSGLMLLAAPSHEWPGAVGFSSELLRTPPSARSSPKRLYLRHRRFRATAGQRRFEPQQAPEGYLDDLRLDLILNLRAARQRAQLTAPKPQIRETQTRYGELQMPVEILHGTADDTVWLSIHSEALASRTPDARHTPLDGIGHMPTTSPSRRSRPPSHASTADRAGRPLPSPRRSAGFGQIRFGFLLRRSRLAWRRRGIGCPAPSPSETFCPTSEFDTMGGPLTFAASTSSTDPIQEAGIQRAARPNIVRLTGDPLRARPDVDAEFAIRDRILSRGAEGWLRCAVAACPTSKADAAAVARVCHAQPLRSPGVRGPACTPNRAPTRSRTRWQCGMSLAAPVFILSRADIRRAAGTSGRNPSRNDPAETGAAS